MHIVKLTADSFLRLNAIELAPEGTGLVVLNGRNAQGKSSVLKAIMAALGGKLTDREPIKKGADRAEVCVRLEGDGLTMPYNVKRTFTPGGQRLEITTDTGDFKKSPQSVLDAFLGDLTFDPLAFARMAPKEQRSAFLSAAQVSVADLDRRESDLRQERLLLGREKKTADANLSSAKRTPVRTGLPDVAPDVKTLAADLVNAQAVNAAYDRAQAAVADADRGARVAQQNVNGLREQLTAAEHALHGAVAALSEAKDRAARAERVDLGPIRAAIDDAQDVRDAVAHRNQVVALEAQAADIQKALDVVAEGLVECTSARDQRLGEATMPCGGLSIIDDGVLFNGIPLDQASQAEMLRVSAAIGMSMNPALKVMLVQNGSLLDNENMAMLAAMAQEHDYQIWIERVGDGDEGFVIEDGQLSDATSTIT